MLAIGLAAWMAKRGSLDRQVPLGATAMAPRKENGAMFAERRIESLPEDADPDGIKLYAISASDEPVDLAAYLPRLAAMKRARGFRGAIRPPSLSATTAPARAISRSAGGVMTTRCSWPWR
jgi:hypothetical protein